jgi:hypothetical protein
VPTESSEFPLAAVAAAATEMGGHVLRTLRSGRWVSAARFREVHKGHAQEARKLARLGLVERRRDGKRVFYRLPARRVVVRLV